MALTRISMTIPVALLKAADRRAKALRRSRSWVIVEALREFLQGRGPRYEGRGGDNESKAVREPIVPPYDAGLGESRLAQLEADLKLTPEERVLEAEATAQVADDRAARRGRAVWIRSFDRYEDYLDWKRRGGLAP